MTAATEAWMVSASTTVNAAAADVFDWIARPENHVLLDGSGHVRGALRKDQRITRQGEKFTMRMHWYLPYVIRSTVSEFTEGERIGWHHFARHVWRWEFVDNGDGTCTVTETFDASSAPVKAQYTKLGYPKAYVRVLEKSVALVASQFEAQRLP